jgi:hypothetical protein
VIPPLSQPKLGIIRDNNRVQDQTASGDTVVPSVQDDPGNPQDTDRTTNAIKFSVSAARRSERGTLIDRGANGGILGSDARVQFKHQYAIDVTGIDNHELTALQMVDATAKVETQLGPVIIWLRHYAYHGTGRTLHSAPQLESFNNVVDDRSMRVGGTQCIKTNDGYVIPLDIINGLPYMRMETHTDKEFDELPHLFLTSAERWNPTILDNTISNREDWYNLVKEDTDMPPKSAFDEKGCFKNRVMPKPQQEPPEIADHYLDASKVDGQEKQKVSMREAANIILDLNANHLCYNGETVSSFECSSTGMTGVESNPSKVDYARYKPYFLNVPEEKIRRTFENTTQMATNVIAGAHIKQTIKSPYPALNVRRRHEPVATDTIFADCAAVDTNGQKCAQLYVGRKSLVTDVYGMTSKSEMVNTLEDIIRRRGAMDLLISDNAPEQNSKEVKQILRELIIEHWRSEPHYQHQNFAELKWQHIKRHVNWMMNLRNVDEDAWLLCLHWVVDVMNHTAEKSLGWRPPLQVLTGQTVDISILLYFIFWDKVAFERVVDSSYSGQIGSYKTSEVTGRFVGFAWNVGHQLAYV